MFGRPQLVILLILVIAGLAWWRAPQGSQQLSRSALIMGTLVEITAFGDDPEQLERGIAAAFAEMTRLEERFSSQLPTSEISRLSNAVGEVEVSAETAGLLRLGLQVAEESEGAFDLGLGALKALWKMETEQPQIPSAAQLQVALRGIGPAALQLDGLRVKKSAPQLQLDLGGIAKGYAVDRALLALGEAGIASAAVNAGGDIGLLGARQGEPWRIGIQHPRQKNATLAVLPLVNRAVVTSGDYERFFERDGIRYHHIFDPRTGQPARLCQSVTVVAPEAATADALATAAFVLGPEKGLALLEGWPGAEGLIVAADGQIHQTAGLRQAEP